MPQPEPMKWPVKLQVTHGIAEEMDKTPALGKPVNNLHFRFQLLGCQVQCQTREGQHGPQLQMAMELGAVPYSAENAALRRQIHVIIQESRSLAHCRLAATSHQSVYCIAKAPLEPDSDPIDIFAHTCCLLLEVMPYLRRIAEILPRHQLA